MAESDPAVAPFPPDIDRDAFGHWLSGFADGEGHFCARLNHHAGKGSFVQTVVRFEIKLRDDDAEILRTIRSFWRCGSITWRDRERRPAKVRARPAATLRIDGVPALIGTVAPHFDRYPLRAKKARDFAIWKQAVALCATVQDRPIVPLESGRGSRPKWTHSEREQFASLCDALKDARRYVDGPASAAGSAGPSLVGRIRSPGP